MQIEIEENVNVPSSIVCDNPLIIIVHTCRLWLVFVLAINKW